jgi:hypothetical protein
MIRSKILLLPIILFPLLFTNGEKVDFSKEVLPILSNKCFACHGPDTKEEKLVRLDLEDLAKKDLGGYHAIDPSDLEESELLYRIVDEDDPMPPEDFGKTLTNKEKEIIRKWVLSGAEYAQHWSFVPPTKAGVEPKINPIDHFIGKDLEKQGHGFAEDADRATLARRASLILNGLPPEPKRVEAFSQTIVPKLMIVISIDCLPRWTMESMLPVTGWMRCGMEIPTGFISITAGESTLTGTG